MDAVELLNTLTLDEKIRLFNGEGSWRTYSAKGKIPHIVMSDGPHGLRKQDFENYADLNHSNTATCFPTASCIASSWDSSIAEEMGQAIAMEAKAENVQLMLGPGMNIKRSPLCGRNFEYYSEDPYLTGKMASAFVNGMQKEGVGSCIKHFACNNQEKRRQTSSSNVDEKTLRKIYLRAFEYTVKNAKPAAIMCSYNKVNGTYTAHNRHLLTEILREEWGYKGIVVSDWGACIDAVACLKAGMDLAMPDSHGYFDRQLKKAVEEGTLTEKEITDSNERLLNLILQYSLKGGESLPLTSAPGVSVTPSSGHISDLAARNAPVEFTQQHAKALRFAQQSAVLLKNEDFLPLKKGPVFVIGELAEKMKLQGCGSSHITTAPYDNALESLKKEGFEVTYTPGYFSGFCKRSKAEKKNKPYIQKAVKELSLALETTPKLPVLFFCGLTEAFEGEGFDRKDLQLPPEQLLLLSEVLKLTENVAIVSFSGAPIDLQSALKAKAILHMYLCGEACGEAVASLVSGQCNPCGKLAETWPLKVEDTPCYGNFAPEGDEVNYTEGELVGYRWYNQKNLPVLFPFGYGLSYTKFEVKSEVAKVAGELCGNVIKLSEPAEAISVSIKNIGDRAGAEVVQIYYQGELCGFKKVTLEAGEEKSVEIPVEIYNLAESALADGGKTDFVIEGGQISSKNANKRDRVNQKHSLSSSLIDMSKDSFRIRMFLKILRLALVIMNKKPAEDPSVKIAIAAIEENPVESLISTSGGIISEKFARLLVKWAN
ncbi:MAG: glycoside hydrolase family 3 C-terminal domain-containing protein [Treponema sp.]|nr:glycoside hydrolase family 3 C-terminal domain-containing protein [Treponema sp.]